MDNRCLGDVCKSLETQSPEKAAECVKSRTVVEDIDSCKYSLSISIHFAANGGLQGWMSFLEWQARRNNLRLHAM